MELFSSLWNIKLGTAIIPSRKMHDQWMKKKDNYGELSVA
jgi:hypothetical protein